MWKRVQTVIGVAKFPWPMAQFTQI
jgi:hypothetical protein